MTTASHILIVDADGLGLAHALRAGSRVPIIMLSGRNSLADRVIGLEMGADDYLGKPVEPRELVARIQTVSRRSRTSGTVTSSDRTRFDSTAGNSFAANGISPRRKA